MGEQLVLKGQNIAYPEALEISWSILQAQTDLHKALRVVVNQEHAQSYMLERCFSACTGQKMEWLFSMAYSCQES